MQTTNGTHLGADVRPLSDRHAPPDNGVRTPAGETLPIDPGIPGQPDLVARVRKGADKRVGGSYPVMPPLAENLPADQTPLADVLAVIARNRPGLAAWLKYLSDHERLHMQRISWETAERERRAQEAANASAAARNAQLDEEAAALDERTQAELAAIRTAEAAAAELHAAAETEAAGRLAEVGAPYDPADASERSVIRPAGATAATSAAAMGLPIPGSQDRLYMPGWVSWYCTAVVGLLIGVSLLVVSHAARPDTLARHPAIAVIGAAVGFGIALAGKWAPRLLWARVGQYYVVKRSPARWVRSIAVASAATAAILGADMALEMRGLLALAGLQARMDTLGGSGGSGGDSGQTLLFLCVAFTVTGAYMLHSAVEGYLKGRDGEIQASSTAAALTAETDHERAQRGEANVREAQRALSAVRLYRRRLAELSERAAAARTEADRVAAAITAERQPENQPISAEGRLLIQDGVDDARAAGVAFTERLEAAIAEAEGPLIRRDYRTPRDSAKGSFWSRLGWKSLRARLFGR